MADGMQNFETHVASQDADEGKARRAGALRKHLLLGLAGTVLTAATLGAAYWVMVGSHFVTTDNAYVGAENAQIGAQVAGQVVDVPVHDTQEVNAGDVLAVIDPTDARIALTQAEAEHGRTLQRVRQYYAEFNRTRLDFTRRSRLAETGAISQEELSSARSAYEAAQANVGSSDMFNHPELQAARASIEAARLALKRTTVVAPVDGVIAQLSAKVGQRIQPGQSMMIVAPLAHAYVDANFKEGQLEQVEIGQSVKLVSDLYGEHTVYHGKVAGLGGGTGSAFAVIPAQNATGNWIKVVQRVPVRVTLDPAEIKAKPLRVGLSMTATIDTRTASH